MKTSNKLGIKHSPCKTILYRDKPEIKSNQVLFLDNRPDEEHKYHSQIADFYQLLRQPDWDGGIPPKISNITEEERKELIKIIDKHLPKKDFQDSRKVAEWIGTTNTYANFPSIGIKPVELVVAHAESHIKEILYKYKKGQVPVAFVSSGSPKMLGEVYNNDEIKDTLKFIGFLFKNKTPSLGICFGHHLFSYKKFGVLPEYIKVPKGNGVEFHPNRKPNNFKVGENFTTCKEGKNYMVFGKVKIKRTKQGKNHPAMNAIDNIFGLEVHSQGVPIQKIPSENILATSNRFFRKDKLTKQRFQIKQKIIEVLSINENSISTQLHPEIQPWLLYVMSYFPEIETALKQEGHNIDAIRKELKDYPDSFWAGQRVGYNWTKRMFMPDYINKQDIPQKEKNLLLNRIKKRNPNIK